jgi:hypothetical protein
MMKDLQCSLRLEPTQEITIHQLLLLLSCCLFSPLKYIRIEYHVISLQNDFTSEEATFIKLNSSSFSINKILLSITTQDFLP